MAISEWTMPIMQYNNFRIGYAQDHIVILHQ